MHVGNGLSRRGLLAGAAAITAAGCMTAMAEAQTQAAPNLDKIRALVFDVQGTCVDFYQPILRAGEAVNRAKGLNMDWAALSADWRDLYREKMDQVIAGQRPWLRVDVIYREALDQLLERHNLTQTFNPAERDDFNQLWNHLDAWPDSVEGLTRLRRKFTTTTLSNAAMSTMIEVVKHAGLPFDAILSAELARSYKPAPAVYQLAVDYLGYKPDEILMVAAHKYDLKAARAFGLHTAFVARPLEFGPNVAANISPEPFFDLYTKSLVELADALSA
jgi:2-haloacid dehalogenase